MPGRRHQKPRDLLPSKVEFEADHVKGGHASDRARHNPALDIEPRRSELEEGLDITGKVGPIWSKEVPEGG